MMKRFLFFVFGLTLLACLLHEPRPVQASDYFPMDEQTAKASPLRFVPNQGQWQDFIDYRVKLNGGYIFFEDQQLTYHFVQTTGDPKHTPKMMGITPKTFGHAFRLRFNGSNPNVSQRAELKHDTYHNYFMGDDSTKWAGGVPLYGKLTYEALYDHIDLRLYGYGDALKYDFLVSPGADVSQIELEFEGLDKISLDKEGNLILKTSLRTIKELAPYAYQWIGEDKKAVPCGFRLKGKKVSYVFPDGYDDQLPLVIDPTLIFSTYTGSSSNNWGFTATYDEDGNAYGGGIEFTPDSLGMNGYPVTMGSYQQANAGNITVTISKFSADGTSLIYATYLGGGEKEQPHSLIVAPNNDLIVFGRTRSPNFPVTGNAYDRTHNGLADLFVTRFNPLGTGLVGSTFIGGSGNDGINGDSAYLTYTDTKWNYGDDARGEVILAPNGDVVVAAPTKSANFPTSTGALQTAFGGGLQDGCVIRLRPDLSGLVWSSYFGGNGEDAIHSVKIDTLGSILIGGGTNSTNLPTSPTAYRTNAPGGTTDGFVARLNPNGSAVQACTYLGTSEYDQVFFVDIDDSNYVYVTGQTEGQWPVIDPPAGSVYQNAGGQQFISKLESDLSDYIYSTVFGTGNQPNISPTAFLVDRCENVYVTGWGGELNALASSSSMVGLPITPDAIQSTTDGSDFYLLVLSRDAQNLLYGSYFGSNGLIPNTLPGVSQPRGDHVDGGTSRFDKNGIVYHAVCAQCSNSGPFPTQPGVYSPNTGTTQGCNLAVFKLSFDLSGVEANFEPLDDNGNIVEDYRGCPPLTINFDNRSFEGGNPIDVQYRWDFGVNGDTSRLKSPTYTYDDPGTYQVRLVIIDSASCNITDTTFRSITVYEPPVVDAGPDQVACFGDTITLATSSPGSFFTWTSPAGSSIISNPDSAQVMVRITATSEFYITLTDSNGCQNSDTVEVLVNPRFIVSASDDTLICQGGSVNLNTFTNQVAGSYTWSSSPVVNISDPSQSSITATNLDTTTFFYIEATNVEGCEAYDTVRVEIFEVQTLEDTFLCEGNSLLLSTQGGVSFDWLPDDGSLSALNVASPVASPLSTTTYTVTARSAEGCVSTKDILVEVVPNPVAEAGSDQSICLGDTATLSGSGGVFYAWDPAGLVFSPDSALTRTAPEDVTAYILTVTDALGCQDTDTTIVVVNPLPLIDAGMDTIICEGEGVILAASGGASYQWSPAFGLSDPTAAEPVASPLQTTTYRLSGTDVNGCSNTDSVEVSVISRPITEITGENRACQGGDIMLFASGGERYLWSTGDTSTAITIDSTEFGLFIATAFVGGCEGIPDSIFIDENFGFPEAAFEFDPQQGYAPQKFSFTNLSSDAVRYEWNFGVGAFVEEENPIRTFPSAGEFQVRLVVFSEFDCTDTAYASILLENVTLHVPSAFTPNDDGSNDQFYIGSQGIETLNIKIFSRWGIKIYDGNGPDFRWDGRYNGVRVPEGVYTYALTAVGENDAKYRKVGTITVYY